jgi:hypothetical protein
LGVFSPDLSPPYFNLALPLIVGQKMTQAFAGASWGGLCVFPGLAKGKSFPACLPADNRFEILGVGTHHQGVCCHFPLIKVGKNILGKIYGCSLLDRGGSWDPS